MIWRFIEYRLRRVLPPAHAASMLGDLAEDYAVQRPRRGLLSSRLWLIREARSLQRGYRAAAAAHQPPRDPFWRRHMFLSDLRHAW